MHCFIQFKNYILNSELPNRFTNPFDYTPHPLCIEAAKQVQAHLSEPDKKLKGKMYGVLVVSNTNGKLGFLAAYSGNDHSQISNIPFVPQVYDISNPNGFFRQGEAELNEINQTISKAENSIELRLLLDKLNARKKETDEAIGNAKCIMAEAKKARQTRREKAWKTPDEEVVLNQLIKESQREKSKFKQLKKSQQQIIEEAESKVKQFYLAINELKQKRRQKSAQLQKRLFDSYLFLNTLGDEKCASAIFETTDAKVPPAGAGDCCAPKLLQYAFQNELTPLAIAEFWWGKSPAKEIRKHGFYYPACKSKCEPILGHMLKGIKLESAAADKIKYKIEIIYDDEAIAIVNKPAGLLSVPGKEECESVFSQLKIIYPESNGPLIVHRLDMATSGIMLIAKTKLSHENLQKQFLNRTIQKRYVALLDGLVKENSGTIDLPLRVDLEDRPRQLVCFDYGKPAITKWEVIKRSKGQTKVNFFPVTGRTHQLRVHAAHHLGLNIPIIGDQLYGIKSKRLMLHAEEISFTHPTTSEKMNFCCTADF